MFNPRPYQERGSYLVPKLIEYAVQRVTPTTEEGQIHLILLHADGKMYYPRAKPRAARVGEPLIGLWGRYVNPLRVLGVPNPRCLPEDLPRASNGIRATRGTLPARIRLLTFAEWRKTSPLPELYLELVREIPSHLEAWTRIRHHAIPTTRAMHNYLRDHLGDSTGPVYAISDALRVLGPHETNRFGAVLQARTNRDLNFRATIDDAQVLDAITDLYQFVDRWVARVDAALPAAPNRKANPMNPLDDEDPAVPEATS